MPRRWRRNGKNSPGLAVPILKSQHRNIANLSLCWRPQGHRPISFRWLHVSEFEGTEICIPGAGPDVFNAPLVARLISEILHPLENLVVFAVHAQAGVDLLRRVVASVDVQADAANVPVCIRETLKITVKSRIDTLPAC